MKRHNKEKKSAAVHLGFQIAPMIDVIFVIMLYFMVMAGSVRVENAHNTKLPASNGPSINLDEIAIRIDDDGQIYLNEEPVDAPNLKSLPELAGDLKQLHDSSEAVKAEAFVTIYAAENAKYERVVDVLDALSRARLSNVSFQAGSLD